MLNLRLPYSILILLLISTSVQSEQCGDEIQQAHVSAVYPTADTLPENLLRFYIYFDRPMNTENTLSHISLTNDKGQALQGVFLENKFHLWSPDRTRLTLLFDPGRVKTGLVAHNTLGRAIKSGHKYTLSIRPGAINQTNCDSVYTKQFLVTDANYEKLAVSSWSVNSPKVGTKKPLLIEFNKPMDHVSLAYRIRVQDRESNLIPGSIKLGKDEKQWVFTPTSNWLGTQKYALSIDPILEDIAGNRLTGSFEQPSLVEDSHSQNTKLKINVVLSE